MTRRTKQMGVLIQKVIAEIIQRKIKDPIFNNYIITVTAVEITKDFSNAKVYISSVPDNNEENKIISTLQKSEGFFRRELNSEIRIKKIPKLTFILDKTQINANKIEDLIKEIAIE
ncbi:MAG: 30S ribosome-binding factor RbfA [Dehalococcoidia bacterium]|jgi:ribosome-binding factor A|nr:MAG: ribosome-binding factor A [Chloroflexota bacterium]|tara:strand:+ start:7840 stop:8187 length:348 start_codon:yes stop_codon:yes gene_type:complete